MRTEMDFVNETAHELEKMLTNRIRAKTRHCVHLERKRRNSSGTLDCCHCHNRIAAFRGFPLQAHQCRHLATRQRRTCHYIATSRSSAKLDDIYCPRGSDGLYCFCRSFSVGGHDNSRTAALSLMKFCTNCMYLDNL